jgi:hypothetical protein
MFWASLICMGAWALKSNTKLAQAKNKILPQNQKKKSKKYVLQPLQ